ncbi:MAG: ParB N-terminal domain-containing protein [Anaerolineae bacterium]|nr:ParB N-terminal domain-containing protein [Anaerolineae bacterium]
MSRKNQLLDVDPFGRENSPTPSGGNSLSLTDADAALFGELSRREGARPTIRPISIFQIYPDFKQPRRAVPAQVREHWSGEPKDIADLFNVWVNAIDEERHKAGEPDFNLDHFLWSEKIESRAVSEDDYESEKYQPGPMENAFLKVVELAVSIRRDGLANPVTVQRLDRNSYRMETGERRWLAFHILYGYFNGEDGKPMERDNWQNIPAIVVDTFNVWRQASENAARADLNAVGRARQFAILMMDLLNAQDIRFDDYDALVKRGQSERAYYAQVIPYRVPSGKGEMLSNGLGISHRAAFTRCRTILGLPDEVWMIGDTLDLSEDELLRLARLPSDEQAILEARKLAEIVATRNNFDGSDTKSKIGDGKEKSGNSPTLFHDVALKRGKKLFSKQHEAVAKEIFTLRSGVGEAGSATKAQIRAKIDELRECLDLLEKKLDNR